MHAPTLCRYNHETTMVQEDVTLGCHQGALFMTSASPQKAYDLASNLSMRRIVDFLQSERVHCDFPSSFYVPSPQDCLLWMENARDADRKPHRTVYRKTHGRSTIVRHSSEKPCRWLNKHHEQLATAMKEYCSTSTPEAVYDNKDKTKASGSYQLDFDDGFSLFCCC